MAVTSPPSRASARGRRDASTPALRRSFGVSRGQSAWSHSAWNPLVSGRSPRLLDTVLGAGLMMETPPGVSLGIPLPEVCAIVLILVASFRPPRRDLSRYGVLLVLAGALLAYLVAVTLVNGLDPTRRGVRIAVLMALIYAIASERLDVRGLLYGMAAGGLINVPLFYAGLVSHAYGSYLTGLLGDKNVSGLFYALMVPLLLATVQRPWAKAGIVATGFALTFLTGSRTSLAALGCAVLWVLLAPHLGWALRLILLVGMANLVNWAEENLATLSVFGDRTGTDWFRSQIQETSARQTAAAPWYGEGLSTAHVDLPQGTFFYHNSYLALLTEGGWVFLIVVVGAYVLLCLRPFTDRDRTPSRVAVEAAAVIVLVTSLQLGEVFITVYGALLLGVGLLLAAHEAQLREEAAPMSARSARITARVRREALRSGR